MHRKIQIDGIYTKDRERIMKQKSTIRQKRSSSQILLSRLTSLCSFKVVRQEMLVFIMQIAKLQLQKMSAEFKILLQVSCNFFDAYDWGFGVARVDMNSALKLLEAMSSSSMNNYLQNLAQNDTGPLLTTTSTDGSDNVCGFITSSNCPMLDSESVQILLDHHQPDHILKSTTKQLTFTMQGIPYLVLPLYDDYKKLDGSYVDFMNEANIEHVADYRVTLRSMLSNLKARYPIGTSSSELTFGIQMIILSLMYSMTAGIKNLDTFESDSTVGTI